MSVGLAIVLQQIARPPEDLIFDKNRHCLAELLTTVPRELALPVVRDPQPDNPAERVVCGEAHGLVLGEKRKVAKKLADAASWAVEPSSEVCAALRDKAERLNATQDSIPPAPAESS